MARRAMKVLAALALVACFAPAALADGAISGRVLAPEGTVLTEIRAVLLPQDAKLGKRTINLKKKGDYFFAMVPDGRYTLALEGTTLVPHSIHLIVYDNEKHKELVNYDGPAPTEPQAFDINLNLKVTYDLTIGPAEKSPAAMQAAQQALGAVPALIQSGDYQGAIAKIDAALAGKPDDPSAHYLKALALFKLKDFPPAQTEIQKTLALNPGQQGGHWLAGAILASLGKKDEAIAEFRLEIASEQADPATRLNAWINIGLIERERGNKEAAIAAFEKVIELDSSQSEAYSYLAELYLATGKPEKAAEVEAKSKAVGAEDPNALYNLGASFWNSKEFEKAEAYFRRATELDPKFALAWKNLGYASVRLGKTDEAVTALGKYLELSPGAPDAKDVREMIDALKK